MTFNIHFSGTVTHRLETVSPTELAQINTKLGTIIMNQKEAAAELKKATAQIEKIGTEIGALQASSTVLTEKIVALETAIANGEAIPELQAAVAEVKAAAQKVDDDIPDVPTPPPTPE